MLHTVNKSPFEKNSLEAALAHAKSGSAILLFEDGVYGAMNGTTLSDAVQQAMQNVTVYALESDLKARGVADKVMDGIKLVDYSGFVDLTCEYDKVQAWL
jgi:tRNA 2-thiouridine synthesizing protein B